MQWRPAAGGAAVDVHWHRELRDARDAPTLLLAHEFLDALLKVADGARLARAPRRPPPRADDEDAGGGGAAADGGARNLDDDPRDLDFVLAAGPTPASHLLGPRLPVHADGAEVSPAAVGCAARGAAAGAERRRGVRSTTALDAPPTDCRAASCATALSTRCIPARST